MFLTKIFKLTLFQLSVFINHICVCVQSLSHVWLFAAPWTVTHQAPLSIRFSRQEYWNGLPFPTPGDIPDPGIKPASFASPALVGGFFTTNATWEAPTITLVWFTCAVLLLHRWGNNGREIPQVTQQIAEPGCLTPKPSA